MMDAHHLLVWQLIDSAFPTGGFAHSGGVEAAVQLGAIRDRDDLVSFLHDSIAQWAAQSAPLTGGAYDDAGAVPTIDRWTEALLAGNAVALRASRAQGMAFLMAGEAINAEIAQLRLTLRAAGSPAHLAVVLGACGRLLGLDRVNTLAIGGFLVLRGAVSAAIRLNVIGPLAAQGVQAACARHLAQAVPRANAIPWQDASSVRPFLELEQGHQDRLYSRLFQS